MSSKLSMTPRKSNCPAEWRKNHWGWNDRHPSLQDAQLRYLYEAHKTQIWKRLPRVAPADARLEILGGVLFRAEQESSAAKPNGNEGVPS